MVNKFGDRDPWGPYVNYDDVSRLQYGRLLWRSASSRARLLAHWENEQHPHRERFRQMRPLIEEALATAESNEKFDESLRNRGLSLRCLAREIPPVFGDFF
jgi:hypothetical protein